MKFRRAILFFSLVFFVINIFSQENAIFNAIKNDVSVETHQDSSIISEQEINTFFSDWMLGFKYGVVKFHGDLSQYNFFPTYQQAVDFHELRTASSFNLLKEVNSLYSIETTFLKGQFAGLRRDKSTEDNVYFNNLDDPYSLYEGAPVPMSNVQLERSMFLLLKSSFHTRSQPSILFCSFLQELNAIQSKARSKLKEIRIEFI